MIKFLKTYKLEIGAGLLIIAVFFATRLANLTILPVFADEAIYVRWSQVMRAEQTLRFLPLSDGKTPLFMWTVMPILQFFDNPLIAARTVSVVAGFGTLIAVFLIGFLLFNKKVASLAAFFYATSPFMVFFDRMALVDSFLNFWGILSLLLSIILVRTLRSDVAMFLGFSQAAAVLTKPSGWLFLLVLPLSIILLDFKKLKKIDFAKLLGLWGVSAFITFFGYNLLRLGPNFQLIAARNRDYVFTLQEALSHPTDPFLAHLTETGVWFGTYFTWPIFFLIIIGVLAGFVLRKKEIIFLTLWSAIPLLIQAEIAKVFTARYLMFSATTVIFPAAFLVAYTLSKLNQKFGLLSQIAILATLTVLPAIFIFQLLTNPQSAPLPQRERAGYLEEWTAGYGLPEIAEYIRNESTKGRPIVVGTEGQFGTLPDGLQIYLEGVANVRIFGTGIAPFLSLPDSLIKSSVENQTYLVVNASRKFFEDDRLKLIASYPKAKGSQGQDALLFYQVVR